VPEGGRAGQRVRGNSAGETGAAGRDGPLAGAGGYAEIMPLRVES
jgi:hypothetical protein